MKLSDFIEKKNILFIEVENKQKLFELMAELIYEGTKDIESKDNLLDLLIKRESQNNTYAMKKVAIPHIKCNKLKDFKIYVFILNAGVDYKENEEKVKIVFMIIGPDKKYNIHLLLLSRIARLLKETPLIEDMLKEKDNSRIKNIIETYEEKII